jgi:hypothetical protein
MFAGTGSLEDRVPMSGELPVVLATVHADPEGKPA